MELALDARSSAFAARSSAARFISRSWSIEYDSQSTSMSDAWLLHIQIPLS
jgi:hypothetical protein